MITVNFIAMAISLEMKNCRISIPIYHPVYPEKNTIIENSKNEPLLQPVMVDGKITVGNKNLKEIHDYFLKRASLLPDEHKRFISPHIYKTGISEKLMETRNALSKQFKITDIKKVRMTEIIRPTFVIDKQICFRNIERMVQKASEK